MVWEGMLWYYVSDRQERLAVPEDQLPALAGSGVLRPTTLIWKKGMDAWISAGEVKPEWFLAGAVPAGGTVEAAPLGIAASDGGLVAELARTLRTYAGWVEVSGWLHGLTAVACVTVGTAMGYFAWMKPDRLLEWARRAPDTLRPLMENPWWSVGGWAAVALLLFFMGAQLIGGAHRVRLAESLQSRDDLRIALRSMGSFFRSTVLTLLLGLLLIAAGVLFHYRPWQTPTTTPAEPAPAPPRERVTI